MSRRSSASRAGVSPARAQASLLLAALLVAPAVWAADTPCSSDGDCGPEERCHGRDACDAGVCAPAFTLSRFPLEATGAHAYSAAMTSALDHSGRFYTQCCDTEITAYTGETVVRGPDAVCPAPPTFPACFLQLCSCAYRRPDREPFVVNGNYVGFGSGEYLLYDGHAGYDYTVSLNTPLIAPKAGLLCKAREDPINGRVGAASAWDKFHTFYVDHGVFDGTGWSTWMLHARELVGQDLAGGDLAALAPGECGEVAEGQVVARVGNFGTFVPHLHLEVRRYLPEDGPEAATARGVDPYGWSGEGPDPIADNPQAAPQEAPLWIACGNGRLECGEACDDGNTTGGDGCSPTCQLDPFLRECVDSLDAARAELAQCLADPPVRDDDADGEADAGDRCPDTPAGAAVDDAGCSREQFCSGVRLRRWTDFLRCTALDWRNDDPPLRWPRDCRADRRNRRCEAR